MRGFILILSVMLALYAIAGYIELEGLPWY